MIAINNGPIAHCLPLITYISFDEKVNRKDMLIFFSQPTWRKGTEKKRGEKAHSRIGGNGRIYAVDITPATKTHEENVFFVCLRG